MTSLLLSLCIEVTLAFFPVMYELSSIGSDKLKTNVKDRAITFAAIRNIFTGILSVPALLDTFKYLI